MKKIFLSLFIFCALLSGAQNNSIRIDRNPWSTWGNYVTSGMYLGSFNNESIYFKTNNTNRLKIDSVGVVRVYHSSQALNTNGQMRYDATLNAFEHYHNSNGSTWTAVWTNSVFSTQLFMVAQTSGIYNCQIATSNTSGIAFAPNGNICLGVTSNSVYTNKAMRIGSTTAPTKTLDVTGNASISSSLTVGAFFSAASTSSLSGIQLTAGSVSVTSKGINTTAGDAATIDSPVGRFRKDTSGSVFTLTNSFITSNSIIVAILASDPGTVGTHLFYITAGTGSATFTFDNAPTNNADVNFIIMN